GDFFFGFATVVWNVSALQKSKNHRVGPSGNLSTLPPQTCYITSDERMAPPTHSVRRVSTVWELANNLSVTGRLHEAVLKYLTVRALLEAEADDLASSQPGTAMIHAGRSSGGKNRGAQWIVNELKKKVDEELESHMNFLRGNYYAALRIDPGSGCTAAVIKESYRSLALCFHPDKTPGVDSGPLFSIIQVAYKALSDPDFQNS
ncbi:unnamed protein product, partial [Discosporangium mesarthrocarpum]